VTSTGNPTDTKFLGKRRGRYKVTGVRLHLYNIARIITVISELFASKLLCTSIDAYSKNMGNLTCVEQHCNIYANVLARKGIYPTKMTKVAYPYITEGRNDCAQM
jgi:hypothetical protein